ncbi:hypothetical protein CKAN_01660300 [Cinnamomum micranthum f. kanehirae]|uniref:DUF7963 domain-containing protein n=1 Tax=Cinnamomum micranthum f. kanehirae TaxID=337451 RepID=A0A443PA65_9MAGN|nr:hypothetical protein CKAN_01660300 [Cinnamomum micranthum f. kanehirae]
MAATCHPQEDDLFSKNLQKRYDGLVMVRSRAIKGKGAWYWSHLEPILFQNRDTGSAKAIKLRCGLCSALFSASNPSRTATEHLKRGTCPKFNTAVRNSTVANGNGVMSKFQNFSQLALPAPLPQLAMIAAPCSSEPMLPSPKTPHLTQDQIKAAFDLLSDWFYESCGSISFSCFDHPKFKAFLHHLGLPQVNKAYISGRKLESKYAEAKLETEEKLRDTMFFQLSTNGWKNRTDIQKSMDMDAFVNVLLNLPNGSSLFHKVLILGAGSANVDYIKEVLWSTIEEITGGDVYRCAGIIADISNVNSNMLQDLELHHHWMVNLTCQLSALGKLLEDFFKKLPQFTSISSRCYKIAQVLNSRPFNDANIYFNWHLDSSLAHNNTATAISVVENIARSSHTLRRTITADALSNNPDGQEIYDMIQDPRFWEELNSVISLTMLMKTMVQELDEERPCLGQCLPLWEEVRNKIKRWCRSFSIEEEPVMKLVNRRFLKNYHQAWSASFVLDPLYLVEDSSGRYLPPFKFLTSEQEKDVVKIITRLAQNGEAPIALMELMKWRTEGLDPIYAQAVQVKERDPVTGKLRVANPRGSRLVWETYLREFKVLRKVAARLIFLQATTSWLRCDQSFLSWVCSNGRSRNAIDKAQKLVFVSSHGKLARRELMDDENDSDLFA